MKQPLQAEAFNFDRILLYSLYVALISFALMFASTLLIRNIHPLWNAILVIGFPYSLFVSKIKSSADVIIFEDNQIILNGKNIAIQDIEFFRIFDSLRLYFVLRITLKTGQQYIHYQILFLIICFTSHDIARISLFIRYATILLFAVLIK